MPFSIIFPFPASPASAAYATDIFLIAFKFFCRLIWHLIVIRSLQVLFP